MYQLIPVDRRINTINVRKISGLICTIKVINCVNIILLSLFNILLVCYIYSQKSKESTIMQYIDDFFIFLCLCIRSADVL